MNHPNRNWRSRLRAAADQWMTTIEGELLGETVALSKSPRLIVRLAYLAGLRDGEGRKGELSSIDGKR